MSNIKDELYSDIDNTTSIDLKAEGQEDIEMEDFFQSSLNDIEEFDQRAWRKGKGMKMPNHVEATQALEGIDSGLYIIGGRPNHGKTALMTAWGFDIARCEENLAYLLYISLDDPMVEVMPRILAMYQNMPISVLSKPMMYKEKIDNCEEGSSLCQDLLDKRALGIEELKKLNKNFRIIDSNKVRTTDDIYKYIKSLYIYLKAKNENYKLVVCIDSINDLELPYRTSDNDKISEVAKIVKNWTVEFDCPIFATAHVKKVNSNRRPILDDLKDSIVLQFEASAIFLVNNDMADNKHAANIFYLNSDNQKCPILEVNWAKNKKSTYKGMTFCYFTPECSTLTECSKEVANRFSAIVYSS